MISLWLWGGVVRFFLIEAGDDPSPRCFAMFDCRDANERVAVDRHVHPCAGVQVQGGSFIGVAVAQRMYRYGAITPAAR
jgi:hypothetical protein